MILLFAQTVESSMPFLMHIGVGGILAIMILRLVFDFIDRREKRGRNGVSPSWAREPMQMVREAIFRQAKIASEIGDLHDWHKPDSDGEQTWKNKQIVELLAEFKQECARGNLALENNNRLLERLIPLMTRLESPH